MIWLATSLNYVKRNRWTWYVIGGVLAVMIFAIILARHDNAIRKADREALDKRAMEQATKAANAADEAQSARNEVIHETVDSLRNVATDDEWFKRMRDCRQKRAATCK